MTRQVYEKLPVLLETNGDCSAITLHFPDEAVGFVADLRDKLEAQGFRIKRRFVADNALCIVTGGRAHKHFTRPRGESA